MQWSDFSPSLRHLSAKDLKRVKEAFELGTKMHDGQLRKSGEPFFSHPIAVAKILIDWGADADTIIAALLHDSVEDTPLTTEDLKKEFGSTVAALIEGVTKLSAEEFAHKPTLDEATETLRKMFSLMEKDVRIIVIKLADRLHNMQTIHFLQPDRQQAIAQETLDIYVKVAEQLSMQDLRQSLEGMSIALLQPELHAQLNELRTSNERHGREISRRMQKALSNSSRAIPNGLQFSYEHKSWEKLEEQLKLHGSSVTGMPDLIVVFLCNTTDDCYGMLGVLHQQWQRESTSFQDYINAPLINGYRGLHTTVILDDGTRVRCKIRDHEMHEYTHKGVTMYCFGKQKVGLANVIPWMQRISPLVEDTKNRSSAFREGLQSDILGESILIHGPQAEALRLPKGSTALDGAFYLYGSKGIHTKETFIDGRSVPFYHELQHGNTMSVKFTDDEQVALAWLQFVHTSIASATIRQELAKAPSAEKSVIGKSILENALRRRSTVALGELSPKALEKAIAELDLHSVHDLFEQLAEGKIEPETVVQALSPRRTSAARKQWTLRIESIGNIDEETMKFVRSFPHSSIQIRRFTDSTILRVYYQLSLEEELELESLIQTRMPPGDWTMIETRKTWRIGVAVATLVILWGLDPVVARYLLRDVTPFDLTFLRFLAFFIAATIAYVSQWYLSSKRFKPLNPLQPLLILSGLSLFMTGFFSYVALTELPAAQYILLTVEGLILINLLRTIIQRRLDLYTIFSFLALGIGIAVLGSIQGTSTFGLIACTVSSLAFALYSQVSKRYQEEQAHIRARYPAFMFWVASIGLILSLALVPMVNFATLSLNSYAMSIGFVLLFSVLPYVLYFECMRRTESRALDRALPFVCISTFLGEALFTQSWVPLIASPLVLLFLWQRHSEKH